MQSISAFSPSVRSRRLFEYRKILQPSSPISTSMESPESSQEMTNVAKASFDSSLAIILAALLCSVLCALGVSAVVRCRLRCRRWLLVSEPSLVVGVEAANTGIKKIDIKALPTTVYRRGFSSPDMDCPICLAEFAEGEKKSAQPAAETAQSARMDVAQRNESVGVNRLVQSFRTPADGTTMVAASSLDSIQSSALE